MQTGCLPVENFMAWTGVWALYILWRQFGLLTRSRLSMFQTKCPIMEWNVRSFCIQLPVFPVTLSFSFMDKAYLRIILPNYQKLNDRILKKLEYYTQIAFCPTHTLFLSIGIFGGNENAIVGTFLHQEKQCSDVRFFKTKKVFEMFQSGWEEILSITYFLDEANQSHFALGRADQDFSHLHT